MSLRIVHLSVSPLAGQPYRLARALQKHTDYQVRTIDLKRWDIYPHDLIFAEETEQCIELVRNADIVHLHNYLDLNSTAFAPLDFRELHRNGKALIRHVHSEPGTLSRVMGISAKEIITCDLPTLVIAQYPERFFPNAFVVRNNLPIDNADYMPAGELLSWDLMFSPTKRNSAWEDRWNTKGAPETLTLMKKVGKETGCKTKVVTRRPLSETLIEKRCSYIVLDDMVTGSYHLSGLEGLSMAKPTLAYLDERIRTVLLDVSGASTVPFINVRLENANNVIKHLLQHRGEGNDIGKAGREWMEQYWSERSIICEFEDVYEKLLSDPSLICRQESLRIDKDIRQFFALKLPDLIYESRKSRALDLSLMVSDLLGATKLRLGKLMWSIRSLLAKKLLLSQKDSSKIGKAPGNSNG